MFQKLLTLDASKDWNFTFEEVQQQQEPNPPANDTVVDNHTSTEQQNVSRETNQDVDMLVKLQLENEQLKKANFALLSRTPITQEEDLSIEDMIYRAVVGTTKQGSEV